VSGPWAICAPSAPTWVLGHTKNGLDGALAHGLLRLAIWLSLFSLVLLLRTKSCWPREKFLRQLPALIGFLEASVRNADADAAHQKYAPDGIGGDQPTA
jgi:hypothetical protein